MPKQFLGYRRADGCPQKNQGFSRCALPPSSGEDMSQSYSGDRHVDKVHHSGGDTPTSSRISAQSSRPTHIYQSSSHQNTDHINTYQKTSASVAAATHSSLSSVPSILTASGIIGNNVETVKTSSTSSPSVIGHSSSAYSSLHMQQFMPQSVLHLPANVGPTETTIAASPITLSVNSTFRGGGGGGGGGGSSTEASSTTHHTPTFTSHLPRGAAAASALSVPKPGCSMASVASPAAVMRQNTPSTIISNTGYSQINRASLISTIKQTPPPSGVRAGQSGLSPTSQIILRPEKPRSGIYGDGTTVVPAAAAPSNQNIQIMLKKTRGADVTKSQVMPGHCSAKAVPVTPSISHTSLTTAVSSKVIASSQGSLTPNHPIKPGGGKWNCGNHLVDLTKEPSKPMNAKALAAISMSSHMSTSSSGSVTQATAAAAAVTSATSSISSSIPIAKVTPQRQQASSHISQAAAAAAAAAAASVPHPIVQETRPETQPHGQPVQTAVTSNYFIPASRVSASSTPLTASISAGTPTVTHADSRQEGRSAVSHMQSYLPPPEIIYKVPSYSLIQYPVNVPVRPNLCGSISTQAVVTTAAEIVSCSPATSVSILSVNNALAVGNAMQPTPSNLANNTVTLSSNNSSPRPSILRKRTNDGTAVAAKKPFGLQSSSIENTQSPRQESTSQSNMSSPKTPACENSQSSTDTALSTEAGCTGVPTSENRNPSECSDSHEQNGVVSSSILSTPSALPNLSNSVEASPRKKPRKQMLNANEELKDNTSTDEEYDKLDKLEELKDYKNREVKDVEYTDEEGVRWTTEKQRTKLSLLKCYVRTWKVRANHFERHTDVKCKEDRRATVNELSNQRGVLQKASGWKLYFLATQLEDMNEMEKTICNQMCKLQKTISPKVSVKQGTMDSDETKLHELTQANIQRCKLVIDQLTEARSSMLKILDHKQHVMDIINKHISKRPIKKKERT